MKKQTCTRCVMDNEKDLSIRFDADGTCNYCSDALKAKDTVYFPGPEGKRRLDEMFGRIKKDGQGKKYDCMMGISGGLDSSYVAYLGFKYGLRILMLHVDDGFDAPVSTENINKISRAFNFDLIIEKPDSVQFNDLTRSFILAGVPDIAIPQDSVLLATLYRTAKANNIRYFLSGFNFSLECITQAGMDASDKVHIIDIHNKYGRVPLTSLPLYSILDKRVKYGLFNRIRSLKPLFYVDYNRDRALKELNDACGFEYYGSKHWESVFTKFVLVYYVPKKFGIDKRKSHYSSMIVSGQMSRDEALAKLAEPLYDEAEMERDLSYILKNLGIERSEFDAIMKQEPIAHSEYKSSGFNQAVGKVLGIRRKYLGY